MAAAKGKDDEEIKEDAVDKGRMHAEMLDEI